MYHHKIQLKYYSNKQMKIQYMKLMKSIITKLNYY